MVGYFCIFAFRQMVQLIFISGKNSNEEMKNVGLLMMCLMAVLKAFVCMSCSAKKMIETIKKREEELMASHNVGIIKIYKEHVKYKRSMLLSYYIVVVITTISGLGSPVLEKHFMGNSSEKQLPISDWIPFNTQKHYRVAYFMQCIDGYFGCHFMFGTDVLLLSFMIFGICQLKILNFSVTTFESLADLAKIHKDHLFVIRYVILTE